MGGGGCSTYRGETPAGRPLQGRSVDEAGGQGLESARRGGGGPAVDGSGLDDGAPCCAEEPEAGAQRRPAGRTGRLVAAADRANGPQRGAYGCHVDVGRQRQQPSLVDGAACLEEVGVLAVEHHPHVHELLPVHPRHAAEHDVLEAASLGHAARSAGSQDRSPPTRASRNSTYASRSVAGSGAPGTGSSQPSGTCESTSSSSSRVTCGASARSASGT